MDEASAVAVEWDRAKQICVPRPATAFGQFEAVQHILDDISLNRRDMFAVLLHNFVAAARQIDPSLRTLNLARLYRDDAYRALAVEAARLGYPQGREDAWTYWKRAFEEFIDQLLVVTANSLDDPSAFIVGTGATAIQVYAGDPLANTAPAAHAQLNDWIRRAQKEIWAGVVPPAPPALPDDDLAQAKAAFVVDVLAQILNIRLNPLSAGFAALSIPDIVNEYRAWEEAEAAEQAGFVSVLLTATCEPATLGYNLAYRHGVADVNTRFLEALRIAQWVGPV